MKLRVVTSGQVIEKDVDWDTLSKIKELLKTLHYRWEPDEKTWRRSTPPLLTREVKALHDYGVDVYSVPCRFYKSYTFLSPLINVDKSKFEYTIETWKPVGCEEYCESRGFSNIEACVEKCEEEDWRTLVKATETVKLWKETDDKSIMIPRGLTHLVPECADKVNYTTLTQKPTSPGDYEGLRDYQAKVGDSVLRALEKYGGGIIQVATGGGKSYMAGWLAKQLIRNGYIVFTTSLSIDLTLQLREFARKWGVDAVAVTVQTLYRRILGEKNGNGNGSEEDEEDKVIQQYMDVEDLTKQQEDELRRMFFNRKVAVILDEAHHVPSHTVKRIMSEAGDGNALRIGLSATPWRNDGRDLEVEGYVGPIVEPRVTSTFLIQHGYAVPVTIHLIRTGHWDCGGGSYASVRKCLSRSTDRNNLILDIVRNAEKPTLVLTTLIEHAEALHKLIKQVIPETEVVTGVVKGDVRAQVFNRIKTGETKVLVATTLADEGLDLPPLRSLVLTLGGKSKTRTLQRVGRVTRVWQGKDHAEVYDLWDKVQFFNEQGEARVRLYRTEPAWRTIIEFHH